MELPERWKSILRRPAKLSDILGQIQAKRMSGKTIFPPEDKVFRALELTPPENVKVVIIGQDPYHGDGQANGLAFSVESGVRIPPSLRNIYKELVNDQLCPIPTSGDLTPWAKQGVLLLNTALTVEKGCPGSHTGLGWEAVVGAVLSGLLQYNYERDIYYPIFVLWGDKARKFMSDNVSSVYEDAPILMSTHPSPFSAARAAGEIPAFMGSRPFSKINAILEDRGQTPIKWALD